MRASRPEWPVSICVLTFGQYPNLISRALDSIRLNCERSQYALVVGANAAGQETMKFLDERREAGEIDRLIVSATNIGKSPMMRQMFAEIGTEFIWWFDDDSYITEPNALSRWLHAAASGPASTVLWGQAVVCEYTSAFTEMEDVLGFVRSAPWYRGLPPPSWRPGGKGEFNFRGHGMGDGRWHFVLGGCFMIRTAAVRAIDWPDPRLFIQGDDTFLGEAIRQQGWDWSNIGTPGVKIGAEPSRGIRK
ncbi:MAG: glycosyltransferase [Verrucomicrobia bacterium]|nr:glycosyltransferase [Verrucomicrobiota bacterium]